MKEAAEAALKAEGERLAKEAAEAAQKAEEERLANGAAAAQKAEDDEKQTGMMKWKRHPRFPKEVRA